MLWQCLGFEPCPQGHLPSTVTDIIISHPPKKEKEANNEIKLQPETTDAEKNWSVHMDGVDLHTQKPQKYSIQHWEM